MKKIKYRNAVFIVTYMYIDKHIIYLVLKRKLHWKGFEFPKGGIEHQEPSIKGVMREIKEETGHYPARIIDHKVKGRYKYKKIFKDRPGIIGQNYHLYSAQLKSRKVKIDKLEHTSYKWMKYEDALDKITYPEQKRCLRLVNKYLLKKLEI
jgi:8-oxo-dGTP pyrophosphatase MutT (NUDIX family)